MEASYFEMLLLIPTIILEPLIEFYGGIKEVTDNYNNIYSFAKIFRVEVNLMAIRLALFQKQKELPKIIINILDYKKITLYN